MTITNDSANDSWRGVVDDEKKEDSGHGASAILRKRSRRLLGVLLRPHKKELVITTLLMAVNLTTWLVQPHLIGVVIDRGVEGSDFGVLVRLTLIVVAIFIANNLTWGAFLWVSGKMGADVLIDLRKMVFRKFQSLSLAFHDKYTSGRVVARLTSDIDALNELLQTGLHEVVVNMLAVLGIVVILFFKDARLAGVSLLVFPLVLALTYWFRHHSERTYRAVRDAVALVIVFYNESLGGVRAGQAFRREARNKDIFEGLTDRYREANLRSSILAARFGPGIRFLGRLSMSVVLLYGANLVIDDKMTIGVLFSFVLYLNRFFGPLQDLSQFYNVFQAASAALEKLAGVLDEATSVPEAENPVVPQNILGEIAFDGVGFSYGEKPVILETSVHVPSGQTVALVGETGAGKSTLAKLIARFYDPVQGTISLDGIDLRHLPEWKLREAIAVVTQESFLFGGTVGENISFGKPDATREQVEAAATAIGAHEFISNLTDGYDTDVKKRGGRLSAGQRQLIAFARAFLADPRVLILDEATSSLDIPTERLVQHALRTLLSDRTAFIIAHRLSTVEIADRVLVVDGGRIVEDGSPNELISRGGRYADLHTQWIESLI
ncbi:MAG: ABC transporter ATP-binding protein [Actinomycetota bacterium]